MPAITVPLHVSRPSARWRPALAGLSKLAAGQARSVAVYDFSRIDRIDGVKAGVSARLLTTLATDMQVSRERLFAWLGIARATANRRIAADETLSQDESERVLGLARLVGQVQKVVTESGRLEGFDAARWTSEWLGQANAALGGHTPGDYMDTADGRALVSGLVAQMQTGAYA